MMPRLRAEEALAAADQIAVGTGSFKEPEPARRLIESWQLAADGATSRPRAVKFRPDALAAMGISVEMVPK